APGRRRFVERQREAPPGARRPPAAPRGVVDVPVVERVMRPPRVQRPGLQVAAEVEDPRVRPGVGWAVPARVDLAPPLGEHGVQRLLVPEEDTVTMALQ